MPEVVTSPSEKLVPIDTSGNSVDVTLKEDKEKGFEEVTKEDAPFVEVVIFRGFVFPVLERRWGQYTAVFLTA